MVRNKNAVYAKCSKYRANAEVEIIFLMGHYLSTKPISSPTRIFRNFVDTNPILTHQVNEMHIHGSRTIINHRGQKWRKYGAFPELRIEIAPGNCKAHARYFSLKYRKWIIVCCPRKAHGKLLSPFLKFRMWNCASSVLHLRKGNTTRLIGIGQPVSPDFRLGLVITARHVWYLPGWLFTLNIELRAERQLGHY
jgi:hypothetical protein